MGSAPPPPVNPVDEPPPFTGRQLAILTAITLLGAALRLLRLGEWSLWVDEAHTVRDVTVPLAHFWGTEQSGYPLSYLLLRGLLDWMPSSGEGWLRLPFAFFGLLSVPTLALAGRAMVGPVPALCAALLLALSPWHLYWSQNVRSYAMLLFFGLVAAGCWYRGMRLRSWPWLIAAIGGALVAGLCHHSAYFLLAAFAAHGLAIRVHARRTRALLVLMLGLVAAAAVPLVMPAFQYFLRAKPAAGILHFAQTYTFFAGLPMLVAALGGLAFLLAERTRSAAFLAAWAAVPSLILVPIGLFAVKVTAQYAFVTFPAVCLLAAVCAERFVRALPDLRGVTGRILAATPLLILLSGDVGRCYLYFTRQYGDRPRWREASEYVVRQGSARKLVLTTNEPSLRYYLQPDRLWSPVEATPGVEVKLLADWILREEGPAWIAAEMRAAAEQGRDTYVVVTEPELYEIDPAGVVNSHLRLNLHQVRRYPCWNGPKDMTVLVYWAPARR